MCSNQVTQYSYFIKIKGFFFFSLSKLSFWSLWFDQFCHFSPNLKLFVSVSLWFHFCCHFGPKVKSNQIY
ncbi:hypothetical protein Hanom_Chr06g00560891 [Helianthus anomalus]